MIHGSPSLTLPSVRIFRILKGNLAPGGAVAKITGKEGLSFIGKARTFDSEDDFVKAVESGSIKKGEKTVVVMRYLGPKGGPGMWFSVPQSLSHSDMGKSLSRYSVYIAVPNGSFHPSRFTLSPSIFFDVYYHYFPSFIPCTHHMLFVVMLGDANANILLI